MDEVIVFRRLEQPQLEEIARRLLDGTARRLQELGLELAHTPEALARLTEVGSEPENGARPLRRAIRSQVEDLIAQQLLEGRIQRGDKLLLKPGDTGFSVEKL